MFDVFGFEAAYVLVFLLAAGAIAFAALRFFRHTTKVSSVHPERIHSRPGHHNCKFDSAEVRRTALLPKPFIDLTSLEPANALVASAMQSITVAEVEKLLKELTGLVPAPIGAQNVVIPGRNTHERKGLALATDYIEGKYREFGIATTRHDYKVRGSRLQNLIAEIPGSEDASKVLIIGSHLDSTAGNPWGSESKAPGADDDASGTIGVLLLARAIKALKPAFTVRFCHFTGEEQGLWGSTVYSDVVAAAKTKVIAMIQMDMIGYCRNDAHRVDIHDDIDRNGSHSIVANLVKAVARYKLNLKPVDTHNRAVSGRSDHAPFLEHGFAAVLVSEEFSDEGFNPHYHSLQDTVANCNLPFMVEVIRMVLAASADYAGVK